LEPGFLYGNLRLETLGYRLVALDTPA